MVDKQKRLSLCFTPESESTTVQVPAMFLYIITQTNLPSFSNPHMSASS